MKRLLLLILIACTAISVQAQYPVVTIQDIQTVSQANLMNCVDTSAYQNDTVTTHGIVLMDGGQAQSAGGRNVWIQNGTGPFSGIDVYTDGSVPSPNLPDDILTLIAGDSVEITGVIGVFGNETELLPLSVSLKSSGRPIGYDTVAIADLNDNMRNNILTTGEQWEGAYIEVQDVTVTSVDFFSGGNRVSFNVADAAGNLLNVSDRFLVQRLPANGGTFVPPNVGTKYEYIRGVIAHSSNDCTGAGGRGYEMYPFDASDYQVTAGTSAPLISGVVRNPGTPSSSQDANISATIEDIDGTVASAELFYAVGVGTATYLSVPMTNVGGGTTYSATIPNTAYSDGDFVKYYICATDNDNLSACGPDVPSTNFDPLFFTVRDNGLTIRDVQFTPYSNGNSGYIGAEVTLRGVVNASAADLGIVFIQQRGTNAWGGIQVTGNAMLAGLSLGDSVELTGSVQESFGFTQLSNITVVNNLGTVAEIAPIELAPGLFSNYDFSGTEPYEGMLVRLVDPMGGNITVVEENSDAPSNFGEYRLGLDAFDPINGCRVLAGRNTGSAPGSLNFSYINDLAWEVNSGVMNVPGYALTYEDEMASMTGIMYYSFGNMKLLPRDNRDIDGLIGANGPGVGFIDELAGSSVVAYPNPVSQELFIDYVFPQLVTSEVILVDLMGRRLASLSLNGMEGTTSISTASITPGTYMLLTTVDGAVLDSRKIVVRK